MPDVDLEVVLECAMSMTRHGFENFLDANSIHRIESDSFLAFISCGLKFTYKTENMFSMLREITDA